MSVMSWIENTLVPASTKLTDGPHLKAIKNGFTATLPLTIIGSVSLILSTSPIPASVTEGPLAAIRDFLTGIPVLGVPYRLTTGIFALWVVIAIAYHFALVRKINAISSVFTALLTYLCVAAPPIVATIGDKPAAVLNMSGLNSTGIFAGMFIALITVDITYVFHKKGFKIKMPDSVPPFVSAPFEAIIPMVVNVILFIVFNQILITFTGKNMVNLIMALLAPLMSASNTLGALILGVFLTRLLWFFGVHGGAVIGAVVAPLMTANITANMEAYMAGKPIPFTMTDIVFQGSFWGLSFFPAALAFLLFAKSAHLRSVGKLGIVPAFCGIGEPINFGTPFVLNGALAIPGILHFVLGSTVAYICMDLGIIGRQIFAVPLGTPLPLGVFLASMDWRAIVLWVILTALCTLIYYPFVKAYDKKLLDDEKAMGNAEVN